MLIGSQIYFNVSPPGVS